MAAPPSPEFRFIAVCCRWPRDAGNIGEITGLAMPGLDWSRVAAIARRHRVESMVGQALKQAGVAQDQPELAEMRAASAGRVRENLFYAAATATLQTAFVGAGLPVVFAKGLPLAIMAYGSLALKASRDIDLLVTPDQAMRAGEILTATGYVRVSPGERLAPEGLGEWHRFNKETSWLDLRTGVLVELHSRLLDDPTLSPAIDRAEETIEVEICPGFLTVRTLSVPMCYAYLCAHGASHGWHRFKYLVDLAALVRFNQISIADLHAAACRLGVERCSAQALLLASDLLGLPAPPAMLAALRRSRINRITRNVGLASFCGKNETVEPEHRTIEAPVTLASYFLLRKGMKARLSQLKWMMINPYDRAAKLLPPRLEFLYPLLTLGRWTRRLAGLAPKQ